MPRSPLQWSTHQAITTIEGKKVEIDLFPYGYSINTVFFSGFGYSPDCATVLWGLYKMRFLGN